MKPTFMVLGAIVLVLILGYFSSDMDLDMPGQVLLNYFSDTLGAQRGENVALYVRYQEILRLNAEVFIIFGVPYRRCLSERENNFMDTCFKTNMRLINEGYDCYWRGQTTLGTSRFWKVRDSVLQKFDSAFTNCKTVFKMLSEKDCFGDGFNGVMASEKSDNGYAL